ncbi:hypothetical protein GYMLUDRAFT_216523 [Collybiopsis luxurians FD-317 M1]|nr:hypothetical protein GYMLUDRAFT_216523 [Collybiopsis luxurians FD-317 M1]
MSDSAPVNSQIYWNQLPSLDNLDISVLEQAVSNGHHIALVEALVETENPMENADIQAEGETMRLSVSQNSSFSIEPGLEAAMLSYEEPLLTQSPEPSKSTSSSSTLTVNSDSTLRSYGVLETSSSTTFGKNDSGSTADLSKYSRDNVSNVSTLGKRAANDISLSDVRARKIKRQSEPPPTPYPPVLVAYSKPFQHFLDCRNLPWGVEWEIARLVSIGKFGYEDFEISGLDKLKNEGSNAKAVPLVEKLLVKKTANESSSSVDTQLFGNEYRARFPYQELDLEDKYLRENCYAGLGFDTNEDWFGGKVMFRGKLKPADEKKPPQFKIELERPELGASSRFTRRFGSKSFMRIKIPKDLSRYRDALMNYFRRPFIVSGKVFRAFLEKERTVFLFMTNEYPEKELVANPNSSSLSFLDFLNWHNPIELNKAQSAAKYASRFALGLSTSAPGLLLKPENIFFIDDVISSDGSDMTDGAGLVNKAALRLLYRKFDWAEWPTAFQCRIAGAKGMLLQHPDDDHLEPRVWIRNSMNKIKYLNLNSDRALCVVDVLRASHPRFTCKLSSETIIILAENGVPKKVFFSLLDKTLDSLVTSLTTWETRHDMEELWLTLSRLGGVFSARSARQKSGMARVQGYSELDAHDDDDDDGLDDGGDEERSTAWWDDEVSGQPSSLEETVMGLIDGSFKPQECPVMRDKLKKILISQITNHVANFRIEVPMSFTAFILPDPEGVLEEGQIYFKSSTRSILMHDGQYTDVLVGPVVVTRHPCKLPTDAQKWYAVDRPELRHYTDVIIISIKGSRRGADWLGGGDYDGDKALALHQPEIVEYFTNADPKFGDPRDDIKTEFFDHRTESLDELLERGPTAPKNHLTTIHAVQEYLLGGIKTASLVGQVSNMHEFLLYTRGPKDPETIRMAHIFCHTLDGMKTGLKMKPEKWKEDIARYDKGAMAWKESDRKGRKGSTTARANNIMVERPRDFPPFIMDELQKYAKAKGDKEKAEVEKTYKRIPVALDQDLAAPWAEAKELAERGNDSMKQSLPLIEAHVSRMWQKHRQRLGKQPNGSQFTDLSIESRQDILRGLSREFASSADQKDCLVRQDELLRLKASYAYIYDFEKARTKWTRFPWDVAMGELSAIKARATGRSRTVAGNFYENFTLRKRR